MLLAAITLRLDPRRLMPEATLGSLIFGIAALNAAFLTNSSWAVGFAAGCFFAACWLWHHAEDPGARGHQDEFDLIRSPWVAGWIFSAATVTATRVAVFLSNLEPAAMPPVLGIAGFVLVGLAVLARCERLGPCAAERGRALSGFQSIHRCQTPGAVGGVGRFAHPRCRHPPAGMETLRHRGHPAGDGIRRAVSVLVEMAAGKFRRCRGVDGAGTHRPGIHHPTSPAGGSLGIPSSFHLLVRVRIHRLLTTAKTTAAPANSPPPPRSPGADPSASSRRTAGHPARG